MYAYCPQRVEESTRLLGTGVIEATMCALGTEPGFSTRAISASASAPSLWSRNLFFNHSPNVLANLPIFLYVFK